MMRRSIGIGLGLLPVLLAAPAVAADEPVPRIIVSGSGSVSTMPDRVSIAFAVRGEGQTSDDAVRAMVAKRKAIDSGLATFADRPEARAGQVSINEVRGRDCNRIPYGMPQLSTGECAIVGYAADLAVTIQTADVTDAGTIIGLIGRLGASNPRIERFSLASDGEARRRATVAALADARQQAEAIAEGTHVKLGPLLSASDTGGQIQPFADFAVAGGREATLLAPAPPPPPPIPVDLKPRPIETQVRVQVIYSIAP